MGSYAGLEVVICFLFGKLITVASLWTVVGKPARAYYTLHASIIDVSLWERRRTRIPYTVEPPFVE